MNSVKEQITKAIAGSGIDTSGIQFEYPADLSHGDLSTNIAMVCAKEKNASPKELAEKIIGGLGEVEGVEKVEVAGPGFINFYFSNKFFADAIKNTMSVEDAWGKSSAYKGREIMVEHTQPNPFKVFHIGHLMSNTIGESLSRVIEFLGAKVIRANYQGDIGPHVAKAIWGIKKLGVDPSDAGALGKAYAAGAKAYEEDAKAKEEIDDLNELLYKGEDEKLNKIYKTGRGASLKHFDEIYKILGTKFERLYFESESAPVGKKIVEEHPEVFPESDGAHVFRGEEYGLHTRVFLTSKGLPTYEAKDLGLVFLKEKEYPNCDEFIVTTAVEQKGYFEVVKKALEQINKALAAKLVHISHGMMRLPSGKMSSRTGDVITGESLLKDMTAKAKERSKETRAEDTDALAQQIAVAAIKYQVLKQSAGKDIVFDEERAFSLEGDSGPYLQYAYARARAILEKAKEEHVSPQSDENTEPNDVARVLVRFPDVVERAAREYEPHYVANYISDVASRFNSWYAREHIVDGTPSAPHKVALTAAVAVTLKNGLWLLGIEAPEKI